MSETDKAKRRNIPGEDPYFAFSDTDRAILTNPVITPEGVMMRPKPEFLEEIERIRRANLVIQKKRRSIHRVS